MLSRIMETLFYITAIVIVVLVFALNCLQGVPGFKYFGFIEGCNYGLTSQDLRIKAGGMVVFILFVTLLFGPILAVLQNHRGIKGTRRAT